MEAKEKKQEANVEREGVVCTSCQTFEEMSKCEQCYGKVPPADNLTARNANDY